MKYAAVIEYLKDPATVEAARPAHRAYLTSLLEKGQLFASGPFEDGYGALIVYEADSPEAVEAIMKADPFHAAGVFVRWTVRPWKVVFANPKLLPPGA
ncbi:MAG: YciI family protein [Gemmataceae bacterium]|nr:YciI family protein [Gemmataceae bacterium]